MSTRGRDGAGDLPYTGSLGATRYEPVFVTATDGTARRVDIVRAVNAATDQALAGAAMEGTLHRLDGGVYLAVPYVYHDPGARRFALVVPVARAHEELSLRGDLLRQLSSDLSAPIPAYVRDARVVIGMEGLQRYVGESNEAREVREVRVAEIETRLEAVTQREERLRDRAEDITTREDELSHRVEEVEVQKSDLQIREQELEQRLTDLLAREEALVDEERALLANKNALQARERMLSAREEALEVRERELEVRETRHLEAALTRDADMRPSRVGERRTMEVDPIPDSDSLEASEAEDDEPLEAGEPVDEPTPLPAPLPKAEDDEIRAFAPPADTSGADSSVAETLEADEVEQVDDDVIPGAPAVALPPEWAARGHDAYAAVVEGEVRFWAKGDGEHAARLAQGGATLRLQAEPDSTAPLALLTVLGTEERERFARVVLDITRPDDRAVLETLARDFRVRLEVVSKGGRALGSYAVAAAAEGNAQRVLSVLAARATGTADTRDTETARLLRDGIQSAEGDAFDRDFADETVLASVVGATNAVKAYEPLLDALTLDRLVLSRGVSVTRVDSIGKRVILAALRCGIALPARLVQRAVEIGVAADERALAARALSAYGRTCESGIENIGRSRGDASRAWGPLVAWAERAGAPVPDGARAAMRTLFDPDDPDAIAPPDPRPTPTVEAIAGMSDDELSRWADHTAGREAIAREMSRRDPARFAEPLSRALRLVPTEAAAEIAIRMVEAGDALGDVWVELLGSRRPTAAAMAAVATAKLHLRRGLNPMVQSALTKENENWSIFAWAAGEFGVAVVRALGRLEGVDIDRLAWILAHAVRSGAGRDVEKARSAPNKMLAEAATRAVGRVDEARAYDAALRHGPGATDAERAAHGMLSRATIVGTAAGVA